MNTSKKLAKLMLTVPVLRHAVLGAYARRLRKIYFGRQLRSIWPILVETGELHNFTYDLTEENLRYLAEIIAVATGKSALEIEGYVQEAVNDTVLRQYFNSRMASYSGQQSSVHLKSPFGRRLGWYAVARAIKPTVVVETGVERGHGALLLCAALLRNQEDGVRGRYYGTDINPTAGWLLSGPYAEVGKILVGDSITSLRALSGPVDLFVNDSDHSADYEAREYDVVAPLLSAHAIVLGDNAHVTDKLALFSRKTGRHFLMFAERPESHWYPGGGIGISFTKPK